MNLFTFKGVQPRYHLRELLSNSCKFFCVHWSLRLVDKTVTIRFEGEVPKT